MNATERDTISDQEPPLVIASMNQKLVVFATSVLTRISVGMTWERVLWSGRGLSSMNIHLMWLWKAPRSEASKCPGLFPFSQRANQALMHIVFHLDKQLERRTTGRHLRRHRGARHSSMNEFILLEITRVWGVFPFVRATSEEKNQLIARKPAWENKSNKTVSRTVWNLGICADFTHSALTPCTGPVRWNAPNRTFLLLVYDQKYLHLFHIA